MTCDFCAVEVAEIFDVPCLGRLACLCRGCWGRHGYAPHREKRQRLERPRPHAHQLLLFEPDRIGRDCPDQG
jgi:hypothetical protein